MKHAIDVVALGHIVNERIVFPDGKVVGPVLGSPPAYFSVCMAKQGVNVGIVTKISNDFPRNLLEVFDDVGVDSEGVILSKNSTRSELIYDEQGDKTLNYLTRAENIFYTDMPEKYWSAKIIYICPMDREIDIDIIEQLSKKEKIMMVDVMGYGGATTSPQPSEKSRDELQRMVPFFEIVKGSIEDFRKIFDEDDIDEKIAAKKIISRGTDICIVTLGEGGCFVMTQQEEKHIPVFPDTKKKDQTGAGDCFSAGFLAYFLQTRDPFAAAVHGNATASYVIEQSGGVVAKRMPNSEEVARRAETIMRELRA